VVTCVSYICVAIAALLVVVVVGFLFVSDSGCIHQEVYCVRCLQQRQKTYVSSMISITTCFMLKSQVCWPIFLLCF